jgi:radical SAM protein with 4Fe4S-binding SPASM domain
MSDTLYKKIIDEASQLPRLQTIIPMLTGEPFCDPKIIERIKYINSRMPWIGIQLYTNGSLLTYEIVQKLKEIPNFSLSISLNGLAPKTREKLMGLKDWNHAVRMVKYAEQIKLPSRVTMVAYPEIDEAERKEFIQDGGMALQYQSWAGQQYPYKRNRWTSCIRALSHMTVRYNGDANLCCFDPFGKVSFGNLNNQTITEIWDSPKRQEYINLHKEGRGNTLELCDSCTEA